MKTEQTMILILEVMISSFIATIRVVSFINNAWHIILCGTMMDVIEKK